MALVDAAVVELIGAIYDAVLEPVLWHDTLDRIRQHFELHNAMLGLLRPQDEAGGLAVGVNMTPEHYLAMQGAEYRPHLTQLWGGAEQIARFPIEEPNTALNVADPRALATNKYFIDFGIPQGLIDAVVIPLTRDRRQMGTVGFERHRDYGAVGADVVTGLRILAPHLRRAALITGILNEERHRTQMLEAVLKAVRSDIVLVDRTARMIYANPAAQAMIDAGDPLRNVLGRVELRGEVVPGQLQMAIEAAADGDIPLGRRGIAIPGTRADGSPFVIHVLPLVDRSVRAMPGEAVAAVFIADRDDEPHFVVDAATVLYSLTPTEARVFELIIAGHPSAEMARLLGIAPGTLKWHTLQLYDKTGQHRRSDLIRLASKLRPAG